MLRIYVVNKRQKEVIEHESGPIEFGRGLKRDAERCIITDSAVSRDQFVVEELPDERISFSNLSNHVPIRFASGQEVAPGEDAELQLPARLTVGTTLIEFKRQVPGKAREDTGARDALQTIHAPRSGLLSVSSLQDLILNDQAPNPEALTQWFETLISVQQAAATSSEFFDQTARAVVELIGLECGLVLLRRKNTWEPVARFDRHEETIPRDPTKGFSREILRYVVEEKRTFFNDVGQVPATESLVDVSAAVASPIFGSDKNEVIGVVYGARLKDLKSASMNIHPLEAQLVQLLAAAVGTGLVRMDREAEVARRRIQLEQVFGPKLSQQLDANPQLLEGRESDVTVMFADIRGFTGLAARLGPSQTCRLVSDVMTCISEEVILNDGIVVDYYGDGVMAMWNAPVERSDHSHLACRAALNSLAQLPAVTRDWEKRAGGPVKLGIGLNAGPAMVGNTGTSQKVKYGALGLAVNLAQRVESSTKELGVPILITDQTKKNLGNEFATRRLCKAWLSGIPDPVELYELNSEQASKSWSQIRDTYEEALGEYESGGWTRAFQLLSPLLAETSDGRFDVPSLTLMSRILDCLRRPPENFEPIFDLRTK